MRWLPLFLSLAWFSSACSSKPAPINGNIPPYTVCTATQNPEGCPAQDASTPACNAAGGTCIIGPGMQCAAQAATSAQDCDPLGGPAGGVCCLALFDASSAPACTAAGGTCLFGGTTDCKGPPASDQDCNENGNTAGGTCCFTGSGPQDSGAD